MNDFRAQIFLIASSNLLSIRCPSAKFCMCRFVECSEHLFQNVLFRPFSRTRELYGTLSARRISATGTMVWTLDNHDVGDRQCVKIFPIQLSCLLTGNSTCTARAVNNPNCPVLEVINALYFGRNFEHPEVFHVAQIVDRFLRLFAGRIVRLILLQVGDKRNPCSDDSVSGRPGCRLIVFEHCLPIGLLRGYSLNSVIHF